MIILAVDPGIRGCGAAVFQAERLLAAEYVRNPCIAGSIPDAILDMARAVVVWFWSVGLQAPDALVIEWPQIYRAGKMKGDQNDLLPLVGVDLAIAAKLNVQTIAYRPAEWKGQMTKDATQARVTARLDRVETNRIRHAGAKDHNTYDAIGIGLHHIGRFQPTRVFAR